MRGFDGPLPFYLETGYVEVDEQHGVQLFYYFVRSENDPDEDPLLLWLSGGPGCSGISGLAYEIGPLQFDAQGYRGGFPTLLYRPETWTKVSNIIFVDSPVGTGFSYAKTKEGLQTGDTKAVKQLVIFLRKWLQDHPRFLSNPLYIAGDSYSGLIIPTLTLEIDRSIELGEKALCSLKGYIAGNPLTDKQFDTDGQIPFLHGMGLVSNELYENARENCGGKYSPPLNATCAEAVQAINNCTRDINKQYILDPACPEDDLWSPKTVAETDGMSRVMLESALLGSKCTQALYILSYTWGNDETIQESLGVRKGTIGAWKRANHELLYNYEIQSVVGYHSRLATKGYKALIYIGDHDAGITVVGTQAWIRYLNLTIVDDWRPWYVGGQVAGFTRSYASGLTYATVKGAGHVAPMYKTSECQKMFIRWISGDPL
ncbi:serine carboxypeptidase-like 7 [Miscanthus floridulus]|uniref:serine carboxypeptidase-like 7 n=1 Tax=Miscanthus floridulus TaxID=154761 RepID=UPI003459EE84